MERLPRLAVRCLTSLFVIAPLAQAPAAAQVAVTGLVGPDSIPADTTRDVLVVRWGELAARPVHVDMVLGSNDELRSAAGRALVEVACGDVGVFSIEGEFRVRIQSDEPPCSVDLNAGDVYVLGDSSTAVEVGGVRMAAVRTLYTVSATREGDSPVRRLAVFEGEVAVTGLAPDTTITVGPRMVLYADHRARWSAVTDADVATAATTLARLDLARAAPASRASPAAFDALYDAHRRVLEAPEDGDARLDLVRTQVDRSAASRSTLYHIDRTRAVSSPRRDATVDADVLTAVTYLQMDRAGDAAVTLRGIAVRNPGAWQAALAGYQVDTVAVQRMLRTSRTPAGEARVELDPDAAAAAVRAARRWPAGQVESAVRGAFQVDVTAPERIGQGDWVRVTVTVRDAAGAPVAGAVVMLEATGGEFRRAGGPTLEGVTNDRGALMAEWGCPRCAGAQEIRARATLGGHRAGEGLARVSVRAP